MDEFSMKNITFEIYIIYYNTFIIWFLKNKQQLPYICILKIDELIGKCLTITKKSKYQDFYNLWEIHNCISEYINSYEWLQYLLASITYSNTLRRKLKN